MAQIEGLDVVTTQDLALGGSSDSTVLEEAVSMGRIVLTHDADFGCLAVARRQPVTGIVFVRPGHISSAFTIDTLRTLPRADPEVTWPFILVAVRSAGQVRIRLRGL